MVAVGYLHIPVHVPDGSRRKRGCPVFAGAASGRADGNRALLRVGQVGVAAIDAVPRSSSGASLPRGSPGASGSSLAVLAEENHAAWTWWLNAIGWTAWTSTWPSRRRTCRGTRPATPRRAARQWPQCFHVGSRRRLTRAVRSCLSTSGRPGRQTAHVDRIHERRRDHHEGGLLLHALVQEVHAPQLERGRVVLVFGCLGELPEISTSASPRMLRASFSRSACACRDMASSGPGGITTSRISTEYGDPPVACAGR